jgi:hypothetical protein
MLFGLIQPSMEQAILASDRQEAREALLEMLLAAQLYYRDHGEFPESAEQLVGECLDALPIDPFGAGGPLHYRREAHRAEGATIWSIGPDGHDDEGKIDLLQRPRGEKGDLIQRVRTPARSEENP